MVKLLTSSNSKRKLVRQSSRKRESSKKGKRQTNLGISASNQDVLMGNGFTLNQFKLKQL